MSWAEEFLYTVSEEVEKVSLREVTKDEVCCDEFTN